MVSVKVWPQSVYYTRSGAKGMKCQFIHFPQRETDIGKILHKHLTNEIPLLPRTAQLLFSADRWSARETILQCLKNGIHVLTDRYVASGACYAAASNGTFPCQNMSSELGLPKPDLVFYIDGKPNVKRYYQREFYHDDDYERQVLDNFRLTIDTTFVILNTRQNRNRNYMTDCMVLAVLKQIEKVSPYISLYV